MEFSTMETTALEERLAEIKDEATEERTLDELNAFKSEKEAIEAEIENRKADEAERRKAAAEIAESLTAPVIAETKTEVRQMENIEIRNTNAYIDAYVNYIKTNDDTECRALLTENVDDGTVPVPELVENIVRTAWERDEITRRVRKAYLKGNLKVGFEISADGAVIHTEGTAGVSEENLVLGVVNLVPQSIKKWISLSDEVMDMRGTAFLDYIYDEITYRIAKKAADVLIDKIIACGTVSTTTQVAVPAITTASVGVATITSALGALSDDARDNVAIMNKQTWADLKAAEMSAGYAVDAFAGLPVAFCNHLPAASAATTGETMIIVGDLGYGALMNFPEGDGIAFKFDDTTLMTQDLIRVLGRQYVGIDAVAPYAFVKVKKA